MLTTKDCRQILHIRRFRNQLVHGKLDAQRAVQLARHRHQRAICGLDGRAIVEVEVKVVAGCTEVGIGGRGVGLLLLLFLSAACLLRCSPSVVLDLLEFVLVRGPSQRLMSDLAVLQGRDEQTMSAEDRV